MTFVTTDAPYDLHATEDGVPKIVSIGIYISLLFLFLLLLLLLLFYPLSKASS
jgi:hypothetical protein